VFWALTQALYTAGKKTRLVLALLGLVNGEDESVSKQMRKNGKTGQWVQVG
jgi:hypothetical protein